MQGNKICVTQKGLDYLSDGRQEYENTGLTRISRGNTSSLPLITSLGHSRSVTLNEKKKTSQQLSKLSMTLQKMQKIGIKKMMITSQDHKLEEILNEEAKQSNQKYLRTLIPQIIRKTRDINKPNNLHSRYKRSLAYTQRLLQNHQGHLQYGFSNHVSPGSLGEQNGH